MLTVSLWVNIFLWQHISVTTYFPANSVLRQHCFCQCVYDVSCFCLQPCRPLSPTLNHRFSDNSSIHSVYSDRTEEFSDQRSGSRDGGLSDVSLIQLIHLKRFKWLWKWIAKTFWFKKFCKLIFFSSYHFHF